MSNVTPRWRKLFSRSVREVTNDGEDCSLIRTAEATNFRKVTKEFNWDRWKNLNTLL
ncbi:MAG: hypothetical protein ACTS6G_03425 [Candidatus Hodgkinia cicadicola]